MKMIFTDTHTHLNSENFAEDREQMIQRALGAGVKRLFIPAVDSEGTKSMEELQRQYPENIFLMMGLHPTHVKENFEEELAFVEKKLSENKYCAVGEIGIDLYWDKTFLKEQQQAFKRQIQLAKQYSLPINIHCRDAFDEVFDVLESEKDDKLYGIFHCFTGTFEQAEQAIGYGMKLGIGGVATFKNGRIDQFLNRIALNNIVLETDAPYLAPAPHRGKRNESAYIPLIAAKLAEIYSTTVEEIAVQTTRNAEMVYGI